jgi:hypothetical protein
LTFTCDQESLVNKDVCLFHDDTYLKDSNRSENKDKVIQKLNDRIDESISNNEPIYCIGYHLPHAKINKTFTQAIYFNHCKFQNAVFFGAKFSADANFSRVTFSAEADFIKSIFSDKAHFSGKFEGLAYFNYVAFENPNKVIFEVKDMAKVSFLDTDITKVRFSNKISWGGKDEDKVIEEEWFEQYIKEPTEEKSRVDLGDVLSVYRNLRDNYEFRRRYDEAGKFFIRDGIKEKI